MTDKKEFDLVDESDRGCVLVGAAIIEERLTEIFERIFDERNTPKKIQESLFGSNGPLATFSAKIKLAYALGYISKPIFEDIETIRKLRNEFAHTSHEIDFIDSNISKRIHEMHCTQSFKGAFKTYSSADVAPAGIPANEPLLRTLGYIKHTKSVFALGIKKLETEILKSLINLIQNGKPN